MDLAHHRLARDVLAALASGGGGREAVKELAAAELSKHLLLMAGVLKAAPDGEQRRLAQTGFDVLSQAWHLDRTAAETVIRFPAVGTWALHAIRIAQPSGMLSVAAAAAIRAGLETDIEIPVRDDQVMLPSLGMARVSGPVARVHTAEGRATVGAVEVPEDPYQDTSGWRGLRRVRAGAFDVLIDDLDPFRLPGLQDLAQSVPTRSWETALRDAWQLLESHHQEAAAEVAAGISVIVPRRSPRSGLVSTSSPQSFGAIGLSLPPDPVTGAETLVHETQHLKLGALQHIVTLILPEDGQRFYAPWRDDPRPLGGLLQGTYAHLSVTGFWRRQRRFPSGTRNADAEYARWREATALGIEAIRSSGRLTAEGAAFVDGMADTIDAWRQEPIPVGAEAKAREAAHAHHERYLAAYGADPNQNRVLGRTPRSTVTAAE
jgi:uncharacterized protein